MVQVSVLHLPYIALLHVIVLPNISTLNLLIKIVLPGEQDIEMLPRPSQTVREPESGKGASVVVVVVVVVVVDAVTEKNKLFLYS